MLIFICIGRAPVWLSHPVYSLKVSQGGVAAVASTFSLSPPEGAAKISTLDYWLFRGCTLTGKFVNVNRLKRPHQRIVGMGQTLSEPVTAKETSACENHMFKVGSSCMQGWRINMEDAHTTKLNIDEDRDAAFFAVYDGHGGAKVAQYAGQHLHTKLTNQVSYKKGDIADSIKKSFLLLDEDMLSDEAMKDELAGTTALIVMVKNEKIYCGNVGDSRAVASVSGHAQALSYDHKPGNEEETKRIIAAGGWVEFNRVNGNLALSRALGDFVFKRNESKSAEEQIVIALPDVTINDIRLDHEFLVLACDGIWDVLTNQEVVDFCRTRIASKMDPEKICEDLMTRCLAPDCQMGGLGCDNMTVVLVTFLQGATYTDLATRCAVTKPDKPPWESEEANV